MNYQDKFEVIMPCYIINEELKTLTEEAINSLGDVNLIVVDNDSPVGGGMLRDKAKTYIRNDENLGYAKSINQGLMLAHLGKYIAIANNDIRVSSNWKEVVQDVFEKGKDIYSCHFRMIPYDEPMKFGDMIAVTDRERWCTSSFFVLNKDQQLFLYDEGYGLAGYEDYDYWYRVWKAGLKTAYTTKACYQHKDSFTQNLLDQAERSVRDIKSRAYFKKKWGSEPNEVVQKLFPMQFNKDWRKGFDEL